jgi:hypothetical protein
MVSKIAPMASVTIISTRVKPFIELLDFKNINTAV